MKKKIKELREGFEHWLRCRCQRMTPERRLIIILIIGTVFTVVNVWITVRSIYEIGREDARHRMMEIRHIEPMELPKPNEAIPEQENNLIPENYDDN